MSIMKSQKTGYPVIDKSLKESQPIVDNIIENTKKEYLEEGRIFRAYDAEYIQLFFTFKMVQALSYYISKAETAEHLNFKIRSHKGIEIDGFIVRDNEKHCFETNSILASGSVQRLHIRYISKTSLPRLNADTAEVKAIKKAMQSLTKKDNLKREIEGFKSRIEKSKQEKIERTAVTVEEYLNADEFYVSVRDTGYEADNPAPAQKDEATFNKFLAEIKSSRISQRKSKIYWCEENISTCQNAIVKLKQKIKEL